MDILNLSNFSDDEVKEKFKTLIQPLIEKTYDDPHFKAAFIANPKEVIQKELGLRVELPDNWSFQVQDQSDPYALYINLPVNEDDIELTDDELDVVSGGVKNYWCPPDTPGTNIQCGCLQA